MHYLTTASINFDTDALPPKTLHILRLRLIEALSETVAETLDEFEIVALPTVTLDPFETDEQAAD